MTFASTEMHSPPAQRMPPASTLTVLSSPEGAALDYTMLPLARLSELMAFEAPYLTEKLLKLKILRTPEEVSTLFNEVKKYLVLSKLYPDREIPMYSRRVDEVWHQFVLFTKSYHEFSMSYFGRFIHHEPREAPKDPSKPAPPPKRSVEEFRDLYEPLFGPLSDVWFDENSITPLSRVMREGFRKNVELRFQGDKVEVVHKVDPPVLLCRMDPWARPALEFMLRYDVFYVRELPQLHDDDRAALCRTLVELKVLIVAS